MSATPTPHSPTTVAVLGTGVMGSSMARNAARYGLDVKAWSRPLSDARRLEGDGIASCDTAREAATGADLVVTMVPDARAIESFAAGEDGFLGALGPDAVWIQSSTVGVEPLTRLVGLAERHRVTIVDAPMLGSKEPAEQGALVVLASGSPDALARCEPFFTAIARRVLQLGPLGRGSEMKMVTNTWIVSCVGVLAETIALAEALDLSGADFLSAIKGMPFDMDYAQSKGSMMLHDSYPPQMRLTHAAKDARLATDTARAAGLDATIASAVAELMRHGCRLGYGDDDMAASFRAAGRRATRG